MPLACTQALDVSKALSPFPPLTLVFQLFNSVLTSSTWVPDCPEPPAEGRLGGAEGPGQEAQAQRIEFGLQCGVGVGDRQQGKHGRSVMQRQWCTAVVLD